MSKILHAMKNDLGLYCCCHFADPDHANGSGTVRELLWDMTWYAKHGGHYDLPLVVIEHENAHDDREFAADFWKVMTAFAPLRIMVGYTGRDGLKHRRAFIEELVDAQAWSYPVGTTDLILLREYGGDWSYLIRPDGARDFRPYAAPAALA